MRDGKVREAGEWNFTPSTKTWLHGVMFVELLCWVHDLERLVSNSPKTTWTRQSPCYFSRTEVRNLLGFGDQQCVVEKEEVSLLSLQAGLQLCLGVAQKQASRAFSQEGLDEWTGLWADRYQAGFSVKHQYKTVTQTFKANKMKFECNCNRKSWDGTLLKKPHAWHVYLKNPLRSSSDCIVVF